jgi:hypothetical protein
MIRLRGGNGDVNAGFKGKHRMPTRAIYGIVEPRISLKQSGTCRGGAGCKG